MRKNKNRRGKMKRLISILLVVLMVAISVAGCAQQSPSASVEESTETKTTSETTSEEPAESAIEPAGEEPFLLGLAYGSLDITPKQQCDKITALCDEIGWKYIVTNADQDPSKLIADVEALCEKKPDAIFCRGINDASMPAIVEVCAAADIPLVLTSIAATGYEDQYLTYCNDPLIAGGELMAKYLNDWLDADSTRVAKVGYVVGDYNLEAALPRWTAVRDGCPRAESLVDAEGKWTAAGAMTVTEDWLQKYPEMNVIVSSSDEMTVGVIQALQSAGKSPDDYLVLSYDALDIMYDYIKEGWCDASAGLDLQKQAEVFVDLCKKIQSGDTADIEPVTYMHSLFLMSTENIEGIISGETPIEYYEY
jgi:ABC-type sugar transport system substrate-binding protein